MARGPKRHLKNLFAPKDWMLSKLAGVFAPRPRAGPHKIRDCMPLLIILRNRLRYALNGREAQMIVRQKLVKVDDRARTDAKYPVGFQDVVELPKTGERFRMMYDVKGRFTLVKIGEQEAKFKLCKVTNVSTSTGRIPVVTTHDGRRIRYCTHKASIGDSVMVDVQSGKVTEYIKLRTGHAVMVTGGANRGRMGEIVNIESHPGAFDIVHIKDEDETEFITRLRNVFVMGKTMKTTPVTLPKNRGVKKNVVEERAERLITAETKKQAQLAQKKRVRKH